MSASQKNRNKVLTGIQKGKDSLTIAKKLGLSRSTVYRIVEALVAVGDLPKEHAEDVNRRDYESVIKWANAGLSRQEIADRLNTKLSYVSKLATWASINGEKLPSSKTISTRKQIDEAKAHYSKHGNLDDVAPRIKSLALKELREEGAHIRGQTMGDTEVLRFHAMECLRGNGFTLEDIGTLFNLSRQRVEQITNGKTVT